MNGANLIIECLKAHNVDTIFGFPAAPSCQPTMPFMIPVRSSALS
ncbi:hypothetical protein CF65_01429 [Aggregatibacter actinomycetemcomitans HK1651]|nr:hypothetical protein CF65_01429 [Aggregatibacter actinomycetemcomitans HK1651]